MKTLNNISLRKAILAVFLMFVSIEGMNAYQNPANTSIEENIDSISGIVVDAATNETLAGVRVEALNNNRYTAMTKADGTFSIKIPSHVVSLFVSTPGYENVIIKARQNNAIVVALYNEKFSTFVENGSDVAAPSKLAMSNTNSISFESELQKQMGAEVRVTQRSGVLGIGGLMNIQGVSSLNISAQPLIVLDGVVQDLQDSYEAIHGGFFNNILAGIHPNDIEKVTILKNATALYGAKGGNGVILIDTRRGHSMATRIEATAVGSYRLTPNLPTMMNSTQYRLYANELIKGVETQSSNINYPFLSNDLGNYYYPMYHNNTQWSDYIYQNSFTQSYHANVQGGDEVAMYNFSVGFTDGASAIKANDFNRLNIRFNTDIVLAERMKTRFDIAYSRIARDLRDDGFAQDLGAGPIASPGVLSLIKAPFLSPYKYNMVDRVLSSALEDADNFANIDPNTPNNSFANPLSILEYGAGNNKNNQEYSVFDVTIAPEIDLGKGFKATALFNYTLHRTSEKYFRPMNGTPNFKIEGLGFSQNEVRSLFSKESSIFADVHLDWEKKMDAHTLMAHGGVRFANFAYDSSYQSCHNTGNDKLPDISSAYSFLDEDGEYNIWRNLAYYAKVDYDYKNKYYLQGSLAAETSSRFGRETESGIRLGGVSWGIFPSLQAGWLVSSEPFFNTNIIQYMKLRAGIDWSGNDNINNNAAFSYFSNVQFQDKAMGIVLTNIENQAIQWETTRRLTFGFDMQAINNRLRISGDIFHNTTSNLLSLKQLNYLTGLEYYWCNGGSLNNTGATVNITGRAINTKNWLWEVGASIGTYKNRITKLPDGTTFNSKKDGALYGYTTDIYDATILSAVGQSAGVFFGYETDGVYATAADVPTQNGIALSTQNVTTGVKTPFEAGDVKFIDQNGDNTINLQDRVIIGNPNPDLYGNFTSNLMYKNFSLSATLNYSLGNDVYNYQRALLESGSSFYNQTVAVANRWKVEGDVTNMPKATYGDPKGNNRFSDRWIEDGSYIRLKDVTLSYQVPTTLSWLQGLKIWATAENLLTLTNYLGSDPEFSFSNNVLYQGIDNGLLPQSRSFHVGVKINL